jgi:small-conductance mechanosensitive channel
MFNLEQALVWIVPTAFVLGGLLVGLLFELVVFKFLVRLVTGTKWKWDDIVILSFRRAFIVWFLCIGAYLAVLSVKVEPEIANLLEAILVAIATLVATLVIAKIAAGFVGIAVRKAEGRLPTASLLSNVIKLIIIVVGVVFILQNMGISITPLITALGIGGLATALALQDTLNNLFSGFQIIASRQVRVGDYVQLDSGEVGEVTDIKWRNTTIRDFTDNLIIIPNSKMAQAVVTNFNLPRTNLWAEVLVGVAYDSDLEHVESVCRDVSYEVYKEVLGGEMPSEPKVHFLEFGDSSINLRVRIQVPQFGDRLAVQTAYIKRIHKRFGAEGIEIPFPIRTVYMRPTGKEH